MFCASQRFKRSAIFSMIADDETMPIFTAAGRISSNTMSIWSATTAGSMFWILRTPQVF